LELEYKFLLNILTDLRSDLATRLTEQRSILESAKTEVEHNITGTPELLAVSELQKARLDRQIEQFEGLQRVLVKV
jgi:flagellar motility protein MotE (MotC chaperone)